MKNLRAENFLLVIIKVTNNTLSTILFGQLFRGKCGDVHLEYVPLSCSLTLFTYCTLYCTVYSHDSVYVVLVLALLAYATSTSAAYITRSPARISHASSLAVFFSSASSSLYTQTPRSGSRLLRLLDITSGDEAEKNPGTSSSFRSFLR